MISYEGLIQKLPPDIQTQTFALQNKQLTTVLEKCEATTTVKFLSNLDHLTLHWGVGLAKPKDWKSAFAIDSIQKPARTSAFDDKACQSPFVEIHSSLSTLEILFENESLPLQINFVIKRENTWFNNNGQNYCVVLKEVEQMKVNASTEVKELVEEIIRCEMEYNSWTLMHRFKMCDSWLNRLGRNQEAVGWIYVWMRYSALRKLDWQRKFNTRPSELAASNQNLTFTLTNLLKDSSTEGLVNVTTLLRGVLASIGKGGNNGQRIRDQILEIMHKNGIKEHDNYYEQWHQKLHNNTTPDDIGICEATIAFNETNNMNKFYEVLGRHGITRERLRSFERAITMEPFYAPQLIGDLYSYLSLLKAVHGSTDLAQSVNCCRGCLPGELVNKLNEILTNLHNWDKLAQMERTLSARKHLTSCWNKSRTEEYRECLYLDINLEAYMRQLCEEIIHVPMEFRHLARELKILLQGACIMAKSQELEYAVEDFCSLYDRFSSNVERDKESALIIKSASDRLQRVLGSFIDAFTDSIGDKASTLGRAFNIDSHFTDIFTEESIRGSLLFAVSMVLKKIDGHLRRFCNFKSWQIISPKPSTSGRFLVVESLHSVAYTKYSEPTVLICTKVTGEEEIPDNVTAVISCTELDALAHVCVRARNGKVLLAVCFDETEAAALRSFDRKFVRVAMTSAGVTVTEGAQIVQEIVSSDRREIKPPLPLEKIAIIADEFGEGKTGAKGNNCAALKRALPEDVGVPSNVALPYGTCEYVLATEENAEIKEETEKLFKELAGKEHDSGANAILESLKAQILKLNLSLADEIFIKHVLSTIGCTESNWSVAWKAIKSVWASKYNERVYLSTLKSHISLSDVVMSVLCQEVITGDYAYVLHTANPFTNNPDEIYGELVLGLGETLVGAFEGRAFSFIVNKSTNSYEINSFPNKSVALVGSGYIFRSDSNSEDLPGFAGAGLFDSFVMEQPKEKRLKYGNERIIVDKSFRELIIRKLNYVGKAVERYFEGVAQDIEGVIVGEKVFVVQARPQV